MAALIRVCCMLFAGFQLYEVGLAACPPDNMVVYRSINESMYDRNVSSITNPNAHPLGFYRGTWQYNNRVGPCINLTDAGASRRKLEIMVETIPPTRLCVTVKAIGEQTSDPGTCFQFNYVACRQTLGDSMFVDFYCDSECGEGDIQFWYRLTLSPLPEVMDPEMWCGNRNSGEFPRSLQTLPQGITYPAAHTSTDPTSGCVVVHPAYVGFFVLVLTTFTA